MALQEPDRVKSILLENLGFISEAGAQTSREKALFEAQAAKDREFGAYYSLQTTRVSSLAYLAAGNPLGRRLGS